MNKFYYSDIKLYNVLQITKFKAIHFLVIFLFKIK